jgi:hypothetical protein
MTVWLLVAMLYAADGSKTKYQPTVEFPDSTSCFTAAHQITREWLANRKGWAMCIPKDHVGKLQ